MFIAAPAAQQATLTSTLQPTIMMLAVFVIFWALVIRPQQQKDKLHRQMVSKLRKGDRVILTSGIHGEITDVRDDVLSVRIADKVEVKVNKSAVSVLRK